MEYAIVVLAVWGIWNVAQSLLDGPEWFWKLLPFVLGVGGQALIDYDHWWYGLGLGAAAMLVMLVADLLLVTADWIRFAALRSQRGTTR
jgi:hypothetical protein